MKTLLAEPSFQGPARGPVAALQGIKQVQWRDLVALTAREKAIELSISTPWLAGSLACYWAGGVWVLAGALCTFMFFLTGLRQSHNAQHYAMGIGRRAQDLVLLILSVLMMMSMHAVQVTHLIHHRHCLDDQDVEAGHVGHPCWMVLLLGPLFPFRVVIAALRRGTFQKRWIVGELFLMAVWFVLVVFVLHIRALQWHLAAVMAGECFTAFFAVWTVHRGCDPAHAIAHAACLDQEFCELQHVLPSGAPPVSRGADEPSAKAGPAARCDQSGVSAAAGLVKKWSTR